MTLRERLADIAETPWPSVDTLPGAATVAFILWMLAEATFGNRWVPILDSANLAFHEAGHPLVGILSSRLAVYGGTLFQLGLHPWVAGQAHRIRYLADMLARILGHRKTWRATPSI